MSIDPEMVRKLSTGAGPQGLEALTRNIHHIPGLRDWITLKSIALVPIPIIRHSRWRLLSLIAVAQKSGDGVDGYLAPWGAVEWSWPEQRVVQMLDLRDNEEIQLLREQQLFIKQSIADQPLDVTTQTHRETVLFTALDRLLTAPSADNSTLSALAECYVGILPQEIYPYYWMLVPESKAWLRTDVALASYESGELGNNEEARKETISLEVSTIYNQIQQQSEEQKLPTDLSEHITSWMQTATTLAITFDVETIKKALQDLYNRLQMPGCRLAFVGEFNRGKSTLLNRILERPLLPVRVLPTTSTLTSLVPGTPEQMDVYFPDGHHEQRSLEAAAWDDLIADDQQRHMQAVFPNVRITLDAPWLRAIDVEMIDTPGAGDLNERRTALISEVLSQCDAVVLLVSAVLPLSLTEATFLEQEVLGRHIPRVLVVVSMLDTIAKDQQTLVLAEVKKRVARISSDIPVISSHPVAHTTTEEAAVATVRAEIATLVATSERRLWRSRQAAGLIADYALQLTEFGRTALSMQQLTDMQRDETIQQAQRERRTAEIRWQGIELGLEQRRIGVDQELRRRVSEVKSNLVEMMTFELSKTPDPKLWWEKEFPFRLRRELYSLARSTDSFVIDVLARDMQWLQDEIASTFDLQMQNQKEGKAVSFAIVPEFRDMKLANIQRLRLFSRIGSGAATIAGYLFLGPIGSAVSVATGIASDYTLSKKLEEQKQSLQREVANSVEQALEEYARQLAERLAVLYADIKENIQREQRIWLQAKDMAIQAIASPARQKNWQQLVHEATVLHQTILTALQTKE